MSDPAPPALEAGEQMPPEGNPNPQGQEPEGFDALPEETKRDIRRLRKESATLRKERDERDARLKELEDAGKSEDQRRNDRLAELEQSATGLTAENARLRVAIAKQLPAELADRLRGTTDKELAEDADRLLELVGGSGQRRPPSFNGGARPNNTPRDAGTEWNDALRRSIRGE